MNLRPKSRVNAEFSMSSMTDIVFLLLIFFIIISSVVKDPGLRLILPKGVKHRIVNEVVHVSVDKDLTYAIDQQIISLERLPSELEAVLTLNPNATVSIRGDKNVKYDHVMELVMIADKLDAKVVLALDPVRK
ncbi:MAG: biopolymer transporter ExbD [Bacteroidia bacterium]